jgi:hypothetical protein
MTAAGFVEGLTQVSIWGDTQHHAVVYPPRRVFADSQPHALEAALCLIELGIY